MSGSLSHFGRYRTIVVDPPWPIKLDDMTYWGERERPESMSHKARSLPYETMNLDEIKALPIIDVAETDCFLFCWTINKFLFDTRDVVESWGFRYCYTMTWVKSPAMQLANQPEYNTEWIVVGRLGKPKYREIRSFRLANVWPRRAHSQKPEEFYDLLRRVTEPPRLDIFGRRAIGGFDSYGDESPSPHNDIPSVYQTYLNI